MPNQTESRLATLHRSISTLRNHVAYGGVARCYGVRSAHEVVLHAFILVLLLRGWVLRATSLFE